MTLRTIFLATAAVFASTAAFANHHEAKEVKKESVVAPAATEHSPTAGKQQDIKKEEHKKEEHKKEEHAK